MTCDWIKYFKWSSHFLFAQWQLILWGWTLFFQINLCFPPKYLVLCYVLRGQAASSHCNGNLHPGRLSSLMVGMVIFRFEKKSNIVLSYAGTYPGQLFLKALLSFARALEEWSQFSPYICLGLLISNWVFWFLFFFFFLFLFLNCLGQCNWEVDELLVSLFQIFQGNPETFKFFSTFCLNCEG